MNYRCGNILTCIEMINMSEYDKYIKIYVSFKWTFS